MDLNVNHKPDDGEEMLSEKKFAQSPIPENANHDSNLGPEYQSSPASPVDSSEPSATHSESLSSTSVIQRENGCCEANDSGLEVDARDSLIERDDQHRNTNQICKSDEKTKIDGLSLRTSSEDTEELLPLSSLPHDKDSILVEEENNSDLLQPEKSIKSSCEVDEPISSDNNDQENKKPSDGQESLDESDNAIAKTTIEEQTEVSPDDTVAITRNELVISGKSKADDSKKGSPLSFVDSLLSKMRRNNSDDTISESPFQRAMSSSSDDLLVEIEAPIKYNIPSNPNLMATPIVHNQREASAFVNDEEEYEQSIAKASRHKRASNIDRCQMGDRCELPKMRAPEMPANIPRPRTLAEKRTLMNNNNFKFLMVEQESKIFRQIQRKKEKLQINYSLLDSMMIEDVPINKGPWRALTWLRTHEGKFIQQYANIDGKKYKLNGACGNHDDKHLPEQSSLPFPRHQRTSLRSTRCCKGGRIKKSYIDLLTNMPSVRKFVLEESIEPYKRLETKFLDNQLVSIKPRPLFSKINFINRNRKLLNGDEDSVFLGDYSKFLMPNVKLQVKVEEKVPLDPTAKKYLKEILPHRDLTENWCEFALSALAINESEQNENIFEFIIPYHDNKQSILVREIIHQKHDTEQLRIPTGCNEEDYDDEMKWTFDANADKSDATECEIIEIIKDLTNSTFINLNDDLFTQDDPMDRTPSVVSPIKNREAIDELSSLVKPDKSKKVLAELRRLNANVFKSESCVDDEDDMRRHATAHLGKIERELRSTVIVTDSDTVLLGNQEKESRRVKRPPKRFDDYMNPVLKNSTLSDSDEPTVKKQKVKQNFSGCEFSSTFKPHVPVVNSEYTIDEVKAIKKEVYKMIHVNVEVRRLEHLDAIEPWCIVHCLYKCTCKGALLEGDAFNYAQVMETKRIQQQQQIREQQHFRERILHDQQLAKEQQQAREQILLLKKMVRKKETMPVLMNPESEEDLVDDGHSRRVLPVFVDASKPKKPSTRAILSDNDGLPKIEIVNLSELFNGGVGPIYIHIYDARSNRLNPILRTILNNKSALVYVDGCAYFVDKKRVNVNKLNFQSIEEDLDHPIFIMQSKEDFPSPVSSTMSSDFIKLLFSKSSESIIQVRDKSWLREIAVIIESILRNVKRKIESKLGNHRSELVNEQLSMITRDRSKSTSSSSISSTQSSPLHFNGQRLHEAPPPGLNTPLMKEFNSIFGARMQRLCAVIRSNTLGLRPSDELVNKLYIYRWNLLLQSFEEDLIQVWQANLESETGERYVLMAMNDSHEPPEIENVDKKNIVNIRRLQLSDNITELTRLILLRVENSTMKNMTVLLFGCKGYFRMCGVLNSKEEFVNGFVAKPTRAAHPRLAAKIKKIYNIWYASKTGRARRGQLRKKELLRTKDEAATVENNKEETEAKFQMPIKIINAPPSLAKEKEEFEKEARKNVKLNAKLITEEDKKNVKSSSEFKWFLFNITDDFSDIFIKSWRKYLSYSVIMKSITRAKAHGRAIALQPSSNLARKWPKIYALPSAPLKFKEHDTMTANFLIFGPYLRNSNSNLLLMQNIDGQLMLRDEYEKRNQIRRETRTRCLWIYANYLKCINDVDPRPMQLIWNQDIEDTQQKNDELPLPGPSTQCNVEKRKSATKIINGDASSNDINDIGELTE